MRTRRQQCQQPRARKHAVAELRIQRGKLSPAHATAGRPAVRHTRRYDMRVRVEIMGSHNCRIVGKSQPVLVMINPMIFPRTRRTSAGTAQCVCGMCIDGHGLGSLGR
jgi:hypothetical protein|eukprot:SAG25_NODE_548_length_7013_cov_9.757304_7_plen_108_part_00